MVNAAFHTAKRTYFYLWEIPSGWLIPGRNPVRRALVYRHQQPMIETKIVAIATLANADLCCHLPKIPETPVPIVASVLAISGHCTCLCWWWCHCDRHRPHADAHLWCRLVSSQSEWPWNLMFSLWVSSRLFPRSTAAAYCCRRRRHRCRYVNFYFVLHCYWHNYSHCYWVACLVLALVAVEGDDLRVVVLLPCCWIAFVCVVACVFREVRLDGSGYVLVRVH